MTVGDMDIQLNISAGPEHNSRGSKPKDNLKSNEKSARSDDRSNNQKDNLKSSDRFVGSSVKKRIKQQSLAQIAAKNKHLVEKNLKPILKGSKNSEILKTSVEIRKNIKNSEQKLNESSGLSADKPIVSFVKPSKIQLKTVLAKPKKVKNSTKSLSNIFSNGNDNAEPSNNNDRLLTNFSKNSTDSVNDFEVKEMYEKKSEQFINDRNIAKKINIKNKRDGNVNKKNKGFQGSISGPEQDGKTEKIFYKNAGKISSLFGNNPQIPMFGQRFVRPVHEPVFSDVNFSDLGLHPYAISNLAQNMKIDKATTVQQKAIPKILSGNDVLIRSQTGSGKTLAYALPIVESLHRIRPKLSRCDGLRALIVVPTRELVLQTYECFLKLTRPFTWIVPGYLLGGEKRKAEKARLRRGCTILVATPGRLLDHIKHTEALNMTDVKCLVLDEADRMLDMGYEKDISGIVSAINISQQSPSYDPMDILRQNTKKKLVNDEASSHDDDERSVMKTKLKDIENKDEHESNVDKEASVRQTVLLSATLTNAVEKLAGLTMSNPIFIDAAEENLRSTGGNFNEANEDFIVPQSVTQSYVVIPPKLKLATLCAHIVGKCQSSGHHKMLIFMATQDMVDYYAEILSSVLTKEEEEEEEDDDENIELDPLVDIEFFKLHGNMTQKERTEVFKTFREASSGVLLSTDVAARGLDMPMVDTVIQFTGPISARDYVHRIGRTARAGSSGSAIILLTPPEMEFVRMLESRRVRIKQQDMDDILSKLIGPLSMHNSVQSAATSLQNKFENLVLNDGKLHKNACKAYLSWIRFYSSYPREMREFFNRKELHLGHYAKSFALRDPPQRIGSIGKNIREKVTTKIHNNRLSIERPEKIKSQKQQQQPHQRLEGLGAEVLKRSRMLNVSEYGDGLEPIKRAKHR